MGIWSLLAAALNKIPNLAAMNGGFILYTIEQWANPPVIHCYRSYRVYTSWFAILTWPMGISINQPAQWWRKRHRAVTGSTVAYCWGMYWFCWPRNRHLCLVSRSLNTLSCSRIGSLFFTLGGGLGRSSFTKARCLTQIFQTFSTMFFFFLISPKCDFCKKSRYSISRNSKNSIWSIWYMPYIYIDRIWCFHRFQTSPLVIQHI